MAAGTMRRSARSCDISRRPSRLRPSRWPKRCGALIQWYRTGEERDRRAYDIAWVADKASPVDTINGFTEVYLDARGIKGAWEALVYYVNPTKTAAIQKLAAEAQWFENHMPWDPAVLQGKRPGRHRQRHRRRHRDRRCRADDADRHQSAERAGGPREIRQQVGVDLERQRGLRSIDGRRLPQRVLVVGRGDRAREEMAGVRARAHHRSARGHRPCVGQAATTISGARRRPR